MGAKPSGEFRVHGWPGQQPGQDVVAEGATSATLAKARGKCSRALVICFKGLSAFNRIALDDNRIEEIRGLNPELRR